MGCTVGWAYTGKPTCIHNCAHLPSHLDGKGIRKSMAVGEGVLVATVINKHQLIRAKTKIFSRWFIHVAFSMFILSAKLSHKQMKTLPWAPMAESMSTLCWLSWISQPLYTSTRITFEFKYECRVRVWFKVFYSDKQPPKSNGNVFSALLWLLYHILKYNGAKYIY